MVGSWSEMALRLTLIL